MADDPDAREHQSALDRATRMEDDVQDLQTALQAVAMVLDVVFQSLPGDMSRQQLTLDVCQRIVENLSQSGVTRSLAGNEFEARSRQEQTP